MAKMAIICDDYGLDDIRVELFALEDFLALVEKQIDSLRQTAEVVLDADISRQRLSPDDGEWLLARSEYDEHVEVFRPRFFRGPFLVALYAVHEAAVTEIAGLMQKKQGRNESLDGRRDFLGHAKRYFEQTLHFELCPDNTAWERLKMLSELRNAIAHTNGRVDLLKKSSQEKIQEWEKKNIGIEVISGYITVSSDFLHEVFRHVRGSLEDLMGRYWQWADTYPRA